MYLPQTWFSFLLNFILNSPFIAKKPRKKKKAALLVGRSEPLHFWTANITFVKAWSFCWISILFLFWTKISGWVVLAAGFFHLTSSHLKMNISTDLILFTLEHQGFYLFSALLVLPQLSDDFSDTKKWHSVLSFTLHFSRNLRMSGCTLWQWRR